MRSRLIGLPPKFEVVAEEIETTPDDCLITYGGRFFTATVIMEYVPGVGNVIDEPLMGSEYTEVVPRAVDGKPIFGPRLWMCDPIVEDRSPWSDESWTVVAGSAEEAARLLVSSKEFKGRWGGDPVTKVWVAGMIEMETGTVSCIVPERKYQAAEWESLWDYDNSVEVTL